MALGLVMTSCLVLLALCCLHGDAQHVTHLAVSLDADQAYKLPAQGFTRIPVNLNQGAGGDVIYLWVKTGYSKAITSLQLTFTYGAEFPGYTKISKDLNDGAGGDWVYLWYQRGSGTSIKAISVTTNSNQERQKRDAGWEKVNGDVNSGAGGADIYLWVKR